MTYSSASQPSPSGRPPKTAPLSVRTAYGLDWMERKRWQPLRNTECGSVAFMAYHETRYRALRQALLVLLEMEQFRPPPDGEGDE